MERYITNIADIDIGTGIGKSEEYPELWNCAICLSNHGIITNIEITQCGHIFHIDCLNHWFSTLANSCPLCRTYIQTISLIHNETINYNIQNRYLGIFINPLFQLNTDID